MTKFAKTYGGALYELAAEEGLEDRILTDLQSVSSVLSEIPEYRKLLSTPSVSRDERKDLIKEAWEESLHQYTLNFLYMLCDGNHVSELPDCAAEFKARRNKDKGIIDVTVISAVALSEAQRSLLIGAVEKKTGKTVLLQEKINPSVIGGLKLNVEGKQYDGTVAHHLSNIAAILSASN